MVDCSRVRVSFEDKDLPQMNSSPPGGWSVYTARDSLTRPGERSTSAVLPELRVTLKIGVISDCSGYTPKVAYTLCVADTDYRDTPVAVLC